MTTYIPSLTLPAFLFENAAASMLLPVAAGTAVGFSTRPKETQKQYMALKQPPTAPPSPSDFTHSPGRPPAWVFGPAWTLLYGLMGLSAHLAYQAGNTSIDPTKLTLAKQGATLYTLQLGLNLIWMPLFFRFKKPVLATIDVVALTGLTGWLIYVWGQVDERAGWLLTPYLGWLGFATYLTIGVGYLNDWDLSDKTRSTDGKKRTGMVNEKP